MSRKPDDWNTISLCRDHHAEQHAIGEISFAFKHGINLPELAALFSRSSPKRAEIERAKRERGL